MSSTRDEANLQLFSNVGFFFVFFPASGKKFFFNSLPKSAEHVRRNLHEEPGPMLMFEHTPPRPHPPRTDCVSHFNTTAFLFIFLSSSREVKLVRELWVLKLQPQTCLALL